MLQTCRGEIAGIARGDCVRGWLRLILGSVAAFGLAGWLLVASALAQDRGSTKGSVPPNPGRASSSSNVDDGPDSSATDADRNGATRAEASDSVLGGLFHASPPVLVVAIIIAAMSFYLGALVVWMALNYRSSVAIPSTLIQEIRDLLEDNKYNEAYHRLVDNPSFLARVLMAGVRKLPSGLSQAQRAAELANEQATMEMEHRTTYLATVGTLGPMIGLVGTVYGMITAFSVIALEGSSPQAADLAAGISTALYSTLFGIAISIPAIFFYAMYRNRIARLSLEVGITAEPLLEQFAPGVRTAPVPLSSATTAPAAHPHPFAVSAALAASGAGSSLPRPALPAGEP
jgi:biopolymer transport protein ExbB